jgi:anti-sigma28 factor (negative regulator of flagellin synthesis)
MEFGTRDFGSHIMKVDPRVESSRDIQDVKEIQDVKDVKSVKAGEVRSAPRQTDPPDDAVKLSDSLKLADEAVRAAAISGDVRPQAVARARQMIATGTLGTDIEALADRIIDSLLESRDTPT